MVAAAALALRLLPLPVIAPLLVRVHETGFATDSTLYWLPMAHSLAEQGEFAYPAGEPTAIHVPLYPLLLACLVVLRLSDPIWVAAVQSVLGSGALLLLFVWVRQLAGAQAGLVAFVLAAMLPDFAVYSYLNMSENLSIVLVLGALVLFERALGREGFGLWAIAGVVLGLAALTREFSFTLLLPLGCAASVRAGFRRTAIGVATMGLACALTLLPWMIRNYRVFHAFIPLSTNGARGLYIATLKGDYNSSDPRRNGSLDDPRQAERFRLLRQALAIARTPAEERQLYLDAAWRNYLDDPQGQIVYLARKVIFFWQPNVGLRHRGRIGWTPLLAYSESFYWLCLLAAAYSLFVPDGRPFPRGTLGLLIGWTFFFHMFVGEAESRYHFALLPPIFACAGVTLSRWLSVVGRTGQEAAAGTLAE